ncbi:hypothetical protein SG34_012245 [Thalassomonas viridans]|uniref:Uncharacterized protein n=1 Tax=Thalassomonas viridans TaxID=137584 RepID=A0AAE9Z947_9GAMM|nr:hypothetical protein [Thalassomonas viridans]WDE07583.1 hypothetical protein SG34_012245 [Thalassomonas viridans]
MNFKGIALALAAFTSVNAYAANTVYGTVSEINLRSGDNGDHAIYVRLDVMQENSTFESCIVDGGSMTWHLDLSSPVMAQQYQLLQRSHSEKLPVVLTGFENVCANGNTNTDKIFELSPWF